LRKLHQVQAELDELQKPVSMSSRDAAEIIVEYLLRVKQLNDPWISDSSDGKAYRTLSISNLPVEIAKRINIASYDHDKATVSCYISSDKPELYPDAHVREALNSFRLRWYCDEHISRRSICGM
jgi:hypothetical protein